MPQDKDYADGAMLTPEQMAEFGLTPLTKEQLAQKHPFREESERRRAERIAREAAAILRPTGQLRALAAREDGDSVVFDQYVRPSQISALIAAVGLELGVQFSCNTERSLVDGKIIGVRVTYKGQK